ncbi:MAG TPA: HEAT repeat domain-containing protein [Steroidobacteraceae bacterium]|nr:HEAT repeat domain-containing protein [Steroidobacteraceae bacterium]
MKILTTIAAAAAIALASQARSAELPLPKDGWASWQVEAVEDAPAWCCWENWGDDVANPKPCKLDDENRGFGSQDHAKTDAVRVYARFANGKLERLRTLAAACPVEAKTPIQKLEGISNDDSARWLNGLATRGEREQDALGSLAIHRGDVALNAIKQIAQGADAAEKRNHAVFWLALLRGDTGADIASQVLFNDKDAQVRKHAAFALSQSRSARVVPDLIKAGNTDANGEVRAHAWFSLSQTRAPNIEQAISAAVRNDADDHVREQAVFALSQLPDERATRALIAVAEDRSLGREQRKRAVFWLGQSKSDSAQAYLDKVLMGNIAK